jgi:transcriptional regulator with XRE-family HTH domain
MGTMDDQVGRNVKQLREALGMSQAEVAEGMTKDGCAGFYPQTILKVEKGTRSLKFTEADSLARVLKVPMSTLLDPGSPEAWAGFKVARMFRDLYQMETRLQDAQRDADLGHLRVQELTNALAAARTEAMQAMEAYVKTYPDAARDLEDQVGTAMRTGKPVVLLSDGGAYRTKGQDDGEH